MDFWIPRNHRTRDHQHDNHNREFHVALTSFPYKIALQRPKNVVPKIKRPVLRLHPIAGNATLPKWGAQKWGRKP